MRAPAVLVAALLVAGCALTSPREDMGALFVDAHFTKPAPIRDRAQLFALTDEMRVFAATKIAPLAAHDGAPIALFEALRSELKIDYDAAHTRPAAETFAAKSGNCLSLVILTAAFAKQMQVPVYYRSVFGQEMWSRSSDMAFQSHHVNLQLGSPRFAETVLRDNYVPLLIDFLAPESAARFYSRPESEDTIVAMYWNNRAAESLVEGNVDDAYWYAREAMTTAPAFLTAYNTLGVVYLRHGDLAEAEKPLRYVLQREPDNANALNNLVRVLALAGKTDELGALRERLATLAPEPPFYYLDLGMNALLKGDPRGALKLLNKELHRMPYDDEVHFAIAVADLRLGELASARQHLTAALDNSTTSERRSIYAAKLSYLKHLEARN